MDVPPVRDIEAHRTKAGRIGLLAGDDPAGKEIHYGGGGVVSRNKGEIAIALSEWLKRLEHRVVPFVGRNHPIGIEHFHRKRGPRIHWRRPVYPRAVALPRSRSTGNLEEAGGVDLLDPIAIVVATHAADAVF